MVPRKLLVSFFILSVAGAASADDGKPPRLRGRVVDSRTGAPVEGARVHVAGQRLERVIMTDQTGRYGLELPPGRYRITFSYGKSRTSERTSIQAGSGAIVDGRVDGTSGEVIVIHGKPPKPAVPARPKGYSPIKAPPYSDRAIVSNAWTRAWLLLDIDETGRVRRFKYLNRPGHDLDGIAAREAFKLRFEPARNRAGRPVGTWMIWLIEWPSYWWLVETFGTASRMPKWVMTDRHGGNSGPPRSLANSVSCAGSGPLWFPSMRALPAGSSRLDERGRPRDESPMSTSSLRVYRDCSKPDLSKDFDAEPWIVSDQ